MIIVELVKIINYLQIMGENMQKIVLVVLGVFIITSSMFTISYGNNKKVSNDKIIKASINKNEKKLFTVIQNNDIRSVRKIIQKGVNINYKDNAGETALEEAVKTDNKDIVKLLISKGADLNTMDTKRSTPLSVIRSELMMKLLLSKGANADTMVFAGDGEIDETAIEVARYIVAILPN